MYEGVDLTIKFADEISEFDNDPWAWIKNRINYFNYDGLCVADYIPFTTFDGYYFEAQIAGIDTYYNIATPAHHIDFITRDCHPSTIQWNLTDNNNGTSDNHNPWKASHVCRWLNNIVYTYLPINLQNQIVNKKLLTECRYSSNEILTTSNSMEWIFLGKLWLPTEIEIHGYGIYSSEKYSTSTGCSIKYPLFTDQTMVKHVGKSEINAYWWLMTTRHGSSTDICYAINTRYPHYTKAYDSSIRVPLCFRL